MFNRHSARGVKTTAIAAAVVFVASLSSCSAASAETFIVGADGLYLTATNLDGLPYRYESGRKFNIQLRESNAGWVFDATDEIGQIQILDDGLTTGFDPDHFEVLPRTTFFIGEYDFDFGGHRELVIASRRLGPQDNPADNAISISVFDLIGNAWKRIGTLDGALIASGKPIAEFRGNRVRVERHLRGLYLEWAYESGSFVYVGTN